MMIEQKVLYPKLCLSLPMHSFVLIDFFFILSHKFLSQNNDAPY